MVEPDQFSPATRHELTAALDVSRQAISDAHRNMRVLDEERARAEKSIQQLKEELERAQRKGKEAEAAIDALKREASKREEQRRALEPGFAR
jgi:chromosome segregation ATPase